MKRTVLLVVAVVAVVAVAALAYAFFKPPEEASAPIQAAPILVETSQPVAAATATAVQPTPTAEPTVAPEPTQAAAAEPSPTAQPEPEPTAAPVEPTADAGQPAVGQIVFEIVQAESQARFIIDEVLRGAPKTVVGATDQVAGQIAVDPANPAGTQIGEVKVNARTLVTDNEFRNRAVKNRILQTDTYEFVTFKPAALTGLPESVTVGQPFSFQISGDLTIRDTTLPVIFAATVTPTSETRLEGLASTSLKYADFGLIVPDAPAVSNVSDNVKLELEFVAATTS